MSFLLKSKIIVLIAVYKLGNKQTILLYYILI